MRKILLASHGYLAKGMKQTLELILGKQSSVEILCGYTPECENVRDAIREIVENAGEEELIILTDVFGGSINNECMRYLGRQKYHLIAGTESAASDRPSGAGRRVQYRKISAESGRAGKSLSEIL